MVKYLSVLDHNPIVSRIKIRLCNLIETIMLKKDLISINQEIQTRNQLLDSVSSWLSDSARGKAVVNADSSDAAILEKLNRDLDLAIMKAIVALLKQLPIQPLKIKYETDSGDLKANAFKKYFDLFIRVLHRCRIVEVMPGPSAAAKTKMPSALKKDPQRSI